MWQEDFVGRITEALHGDATLIALFWGGSFGKRLADQFSDVDLVAVVARADQPAFNGAWRARLQAIAPIVFWNEMGTDEKIFNAITDQWQRVDLAVIDVEAVHLRGRDTLLALIDPQGLHGGLPERIVWPGPNKGYVLYLINEFFRVFGLLSVAAGREEYLLSVAGVELLRMMLFNLLSEEVERADKGGMLAWSRRLSPEQMALLASIPPVAAERESVIAAHVACAKAFLPRARAMAARWEIAWPQVFEEATWRHLERTVGLRRM